MKDKVCSSCGSVGVIARGFCSRCYKKWQREQNPEKFKTYAADYKVQREQRDPGYYAEKQREWRERNTEESRARGRIGRSRARARQAGVESAITIEDWAAIKAGQDGRCYYCGIKADLELDHKIPMSRGGPNVPENIVGACHECNITKFTMTADEFADQEG